ncbi:hypothetical protein O181_075603 [Austropuccinia psidii MF-1]|uniref:Uncharacterized protein n=1 Tax=Austropuccinia psidii MF-1 TaxID=1389203 RepID=A0A9Q3FDC3_9BASI|nr:hypothetical protein [Austropuccinia psidii MF-1]
MGLGYHCYGSCFQDFINAFSPEEVERMIFGDPSLPSLNASLLDWASASTKDPSSPPALASFRRYSSPSYSEDIPESAMAFYAFIKGDYNPRLFVPDPFDHFLGKEVSTPSVKDMRTLPISRKKNHHYFLQPCDSTGRVITSCRLY